MNRSNGWAPQVPLGQLLVRRRDQIEVEDGVQYKRVTIRLNGKGVFLRDQVDGSEIGTKRQFTIEEDQFLLSKIDARNGAFGMVPAECNGAIITGNFWTFDAVPDILDARYFNYLTQTRLFEDFSIRASEGTTNRRYLQESKFLRETIPLPAITKQRQIVAKIESLAGKIEDSLELSMRIRDSQTALINSFSANAFRDLADRYGTIELGRLIIHANYGTSVKCTSERDRDVTPILRIPNVAAEAISLNDLKYAYLTDAERKAVTVEAGDILVVRTNGSADLVGRCAVVQELPEPHGFASYLIRLRLDNYTVSPTYAQNALRYLRNSGQLFDLARTTAGQYNVSLGRLRGAVIPVPPIDVQRKTVLAIAEMEQRIVTAASLSKEASTKLNAMLPAILERAFRGELPC